MIDPKKYSESYNVIWTEQFHNVSSEALKSSWQTLATAFNDCIIDNTENREIKRRVVSIPTGSGKTTGLIHYLGMLPADVKALVIVFFIDSADEIESKLNKITPNKAIAVHSGDNGKKINDITEQQVLIVTHSHYLNFMDENHLKERDLIIIDEAIDLLKADKIDNDSIRRLKTILDSVIERYPNAQKEYENIDLILHLSSMIQDQIDSINNKYRALFEIPDDPTNLSKLPLLLKREHLIDKSYGFENIKFDEIRKIIKKENCRRILTGKSGLQHEETEQKLLLNAYLTSIENILKDWFYYYGTNLGHSSLNTVSIKLPEKSVVILDATATTNYIYKLFSDVVLYSDTANARNYSNVDLYLAHGLKVGNTSLTDNPQESAETLIENLKKNISKDSNVLIVTHKDLEPHLKGYELPFKYDVNHFGNLTGKNEWQEYDTVVIYGIMYKPETFSINRQAVATKYEFLDDKTGKITTYIDIDDKKVRKLIANTDLASEVIQAINRVRCRKVIDNEGNCEPTNIYLALPNGETGDTILESIVSKMNNIKINDWKFDTKLIRTSSKRSKYIEPIIEYVNANLKDDIFSLKSTEVMKALAISSSSYNDTVKSENFLKALREANLELKIPNGKIRGKCYFRLI
jgi:SpoU rRNA methylase family enzyme